MADVFAFLDQTDPKKLTRFLFIFLCLMLVFFLAAAGLGVANIPETNIIPIPDDAEGKEYQTVDNKAFGGAVFLLVVALVCLLVVTPLTMWGLWHGSKVKVTV